MCFPTLTCKFYTILRDCSNFPRVHHCLNVQGHVRPLLKDIFNNFPSFFDFFTAPPSGSHVEDNRDDSIQSLLNDTGK